MLGGPASDFKQNNSYEWPSAQWPALVYERDDGRYQIGLTDDAPGPFESRAFAVAIARRDHAASA
jgi:hypothetical protein